jgi:hypothetical protein
MAAPGELVLALHGVSQLNHSQVNELIFTLKRGLDPLVKRSGRTLRIMTPGLHRTSRRELNLYYEMGEPEKGFCHYIVLGDDGTGYIGIQAHRSLRVCGPVDSAGRRDVRRFLASDRLLARALANTSLHELGHFIAGLEHASDLGNYMATGGLQVRERTMKSQRSFWAGPKSWFPDQEDRLVEHLRTGRYVDPLEVH